MALTNAREVSDAAAAVVAAFARHDSLAYFATFAPEATFIFHNHEHVLRSRVEYENLWRSWELDGFRVAECASHDGSVQMLTDDVGIFTHSVRTTLVGNTDASATKERETIVFQRIGNVWLGVHEHLSLEPTP